MGILACPKCKHLRTGVLQTNNHKRNDYEVRRRRKCEACDFRFNTLEVILEPKPKKEQSYDPRKLRRNLLDADVQWRRVLPAGAYARRDKDH